MYERVETNGKIDLATQNQMVQSKFINALNSSQPPP